MGYKITKWSDVCAQGTHSGTLTGVLIIHIFFRLISTSITSAEVRGTVGWHVHFLRTDALMWRPRGSVDLGPRFIIVLEIIVLAVLIIILLSTL